MHWDDRPEHYATHYLTGPLLTRAGDYMLEVTKEMELLTAGTEIVEGKAVDVVRRGVEVDASTWPDGVEFKVAKVVR
ncbi:MAG: hypothetical protein V3R71_06395 [Gemmatimonadales bacterium]